MPRPLATPSGFRLIPSALDIAAQAAMVEAAFAAAEVSPWRRYDTPFGKTMSVQNTGFGGWSWTSSRDGYRYVDRDPLTGAPWPPMPPLLFELWRTHADCPLDPDSALVNLYRDGARMGLHQDRDEDDMAAPVLSLSLGDTAVFRLGGSRRSDPTTSLRLASGDVCVLAGEARRAFHGVDRVIAGSSRLLPDGGRINITLRRAKMSFQPSAASSAPRSRPMRCRRSQL